MNQRDTLALLVATHAFTLMRGRTGGQINDRTRREISQHGRTLGRVGTGNLEAKLQVTHHDQPRASSHINDHYCVAKLQTRLLAGSPTSRQTINSHSNVNFHVVPTVLLFPKERTKSRVSRLLLQRKQIKICEKCFLCHSFVLCKTCNKCQKCCTKSACRGQTSKLLENLAGSGCRSKSGSNSERGLHPPLSDPFTSIDFKDAYFHIPIQEQSRKYQISCPGSDIPIQSSAFRSAHSTLGVHCCSKGGKTDGHTQGYKNPPVSRRLVGEGQIPPGVSPTHSRSSENMPRTRLASELEKSELEPKQIFDFVGYQFDLRAGRV